MDLRDEKLKYCPTCYRETSRTGKFCSACGTKTTIIPTCSCGEYIGLYSGFCQACGKETDFGKKPLEVRQWIAQNG